MSNPDQFPALSLEEFTHWLNDRRMLDVSEAFHAIVSRYSEATEAAAMAATVPDNALGVLIGSFDAAFVEGLHEVLAETKDDRLKDLVERRLLAGYEIAVGPSRAQDALPIDEQSAAAALRKVLDVVRRYLPPDGPTAHDAMADITALVDPWPTQAPVAGQPAEPSPLEEAARRYLTAVDDPTYLWGKTKTWEAASQAAEDMRAILAPKGDSNG